MTVFLSTLSQMSFLIFIVAVGYVISKLGVVESKGTALLSKLENNVFIPALVLGTFINNFTRDKLATAWQFLVCGFVVIIISIPLAILCAKLCAKDEYIQKIYTYGLAFSNFGFMGNAVVAAIFPDVFMEYLIFVLPFWFFIYVWGVPSLLIPHSDKKSSFKDAMRNLVNPMFVAMLVGMLIGALGVKMPEFLGSAVSSLGDCMSPIAMLLTGMTIAKIDLKSMLKNLSIYAVTAIRIIIMPLLAIAILAFIDIPYALKLCSVCAVAMPLGLNTIVVPAAYGKDTSVASGMALVSHLLSCITIPLVFMLFQSVVK